MPSILIIDDSLTVRTQILQVLKRFSLFDQYYEADDGLKGFKSLLANPVDLVVCDLEMPMMDGFRFLSMLNSREELKDIPVIMLTGRGDREMKIKGLEQGASDYVTKPFDSGELVARVRVQLKIKFLQDQLKRSNQMLREMSITDHLTTLYNRRYLMEVLERETSRADRTGKQLSIILLDIDHFKKVNDTYGHPQGDKVLATVATVTKMILRPYDSAARYGGEEYMLVLPETPLGEAVSVAERIRKEVAALTFDGDLGSLAVTVSLGVASYPATNVPSLDALCKQADLALYRAKRGGRNRTEAMRPA